MKSVRTIVLATVLAAAPLSVVSAQFKQQIEPGAVDVPRGDLFIQNLDVVWTASDTILHNVSVVIRNGMIRAIGPDLSPPRGALIIDGTGHTAIPGFVDEHAHIAARSTNECTGPITPEVRVSDALDPESFGIYRALSGGVTTAQVLHGSCNPVGGQSAIIKPRWGVDDPMKLLVQGAPQTVKFALGENVTRKGWNRPGLNRFPATRQGVEAVYVAAFTAAQEYKKAWDAYEQDRRAHRVPPRHDLRLEALVDIMEGRIRVHAHSYRGDEILMLMGIAERFGFKIDVFTHVLEGYKVADELAAHGAGASTFSDWWMYKLEVTDAIPYNAAIMHEHGVRTSLNSDSQLLQAFFQYEINKPVKYGGVSREDALRMLTLYPAEQLLIADKVGSIEVGKHADIVLLSGDPFDVYTRVEKTIVDGILYYDRLRDGETRKQPVRSLPQVEVVPEATSPATTGAGMMIQPAAMMTTAAPVDMTQGAVTALVGATVHPVSAGEIRDGVVLIVDGRISAVGPASQTPIPEDATLVNLAGKHVYPGLVNPMTQLGMVEIGRVAASRDDREVGRFNPHIRALTGVHPHSHGIPVARANGITTVLTTTASGIIQGTASVIQLKGDTPERMAVRDRAALVVNFPSPKGESWDDPKLEGDRLEELVTLFERAVLYAKRPSANDDPTAPFDPNVTNRQAMMLAAMVPAVTGEMPVVFRARRERAIKTLFMFLDEFPDVQAVLFGGDEAFRVASELATRNIPVILGSTVGLTMDRDDPVTAIWENAAILHAAGVKVAFGTNGVQHVRNLPYHAGRAAAFGLPKDVALRGVTLTAAEVLGLGGEMGSIEVGKRADLIVTTGDPLQIVTHVERAFIAGEEMSVESKHTQLWEAFRERH